jgi:hypothetical protein
LVDRLPDELIELQGDDFAHLVADIERIRDALERWRSGGDRARYWTIPYSSVKTIRALLAKCRDESPASGTTELQFITQGDLRDSIRHKLG